MVSVFVPHPSWAKNIDCFKHCAVRMTCWSTVREVTGLQEVGDKIIALYIFHAHSFPSENLQEGPLRKPVHKCEGAVRFFYRCPEHRSLYGISAAYSGFLCCLVGVLGETIQFCVLKLILSE